jgi:hypothetical protein
MLLQDHDRDSAKGEKPTEGLALVQILSLQDAPLRRRSDPYLSYVCTYIYYNIHIVDIYTYSRSDPSLSYICIN